MSIEESKQTCEEILLKEHDEQCKDICARKNPSVLQKKMVLKRWSTLIGSIFWMKLKSNVHFS